MSSESSDRGAETTVDHMEIKSWIEQREGVPARSTGNERSERLRVAFPAGQGTGTAPSLDDDRIEQISWTRFFETFEEEGLAFRYRESGDVDDRDRSHEFVDRADADVDEEGAIDELVGGTAMSRAATSATEAEPGMAVVDVEEGDVGVVSQVMGVRIYVEPDPGLSDRLKIELGWGDTHGDEDVYDVPETQIEAVEDDGVRIYRPE